MLLKITQMLVVVAMIAFAFPANAGATYDGLSTQRYCISPELVTSIVTQDTHTEADALLDQSGAVGQCVYLPGRAVDISVTRVLSRVTSSFAGELYVIEFTVKSSGDKMYWVTPVWIGDKIKEFLRGT